MTLLESDLTPLQAEIAREVDTLHRESYEERMLRVLSGGDAAKASAMRDTPLFALALYGIKHFNPPNGNMGRSYHSRNHSKGEAK